MKRDSFVVKRELGPLIFHRKDFHYYGLQNGDECHCGNNTTNFIPAPLYQCNKPCTGDQSQFCGSSWRLNVFQKNRPITEESTAAPSTKSTTVPTTIQLTETTTIDRDARTVISLSVQTTEYQD